jgi:hypothetical protein
VQALLYKTAVLTGLRQGELAALRVAFLKLDRKPFPALELPGEFTKNGDDAKLLLVPALAEELRQWIADAGKKPTDKLFSVSDKANKIFRRDQRAAGIPYRDDLGRYADFHALRHSANTMLGTAGIPPKLRQLFMRHSDIRLTTATYDDDSLYEMEPAPDPFDPAKLRLTQGTATFGVKKHHTTLPVRKPSKEWFVRCHDDPAYRLETCVLELKEDSEILPRLPPRAGRPRRREYGQPPAARHRHQQAGDAVPLADPLAGAGRPA